MKKDVETIQRGLSCCSVNDASNCDVCPYDGNCMDLEKDANDVINILLAKITELESIVEAMSTDIDNKLEYIYQLEERLGIVLEQHSEN